MLEMATVEVLEDLVRWAAQGKRAAIARVVGTEGSSPREPGATMAVNELGEVSGSVSGGCVEGAVVEEALALMGITHLVTESGARMELSAGMGEACPTVSVFGYSDDEAFAVGLTCGGTLKILIDPETPGLYPLMLELLRAETPFVRATVVAAADSTAGVDGAELSTEGVNAYEVFGPLPAAGASLLIEGEGTVHGDLGNPELAAVIARDAAGALAAGSTMVRHYGRNGQAKLDEVEVLYEVYAPAPRMVIFGAVDFSAALARLGKMLGYRVTVCDARPLFATRQRFPMADEVAVDWPDRYLARAGAGLGPRDAVCVLTHDPKFDVPAISSALATKVGYIGAMGSRRTHQERTKRLVEAGVDPAAMDRVMGPIGLDIGARTPEETAVAIMAEIIALRSSRAAGSLRESSGPIHASLESTGRL